MSPKLSIAAAGLAAICAVQAAVVPSRVQLQDRVESTTPAATVPPVSYATPTEGITVTLTQVPPPRSNPGPEYLSPLFQSASSLGWVPISVVPTNQSHCPLTQQEIQATITERVATQAIDPRQNLACCFGVIVGDFGDVEPENISTILTQNQHYGCFATAASQTTLPYGIEQASVDMFTSSRPYQILTTIVTGAASSQTPSFSGGMMLFTAFTAFVGAAVLLL